jgi:hypothetical protein
MTLNYGKFKDKMKFEHTSENTKPEISFILLDWTCRESFHVLEHFEKQNVERTSYEIVWIEFYQRRSDEIRQRIDKALAEGRPSPVDQWIVMDMPENIYYHKHLMYNIGIVYSHGRIICIMDSDAIVSISIVQSIIDCFKKNSNIILHLDEIRNINQSFYPFKNPTIKEILGEGCINFKDGKTLGLLDTEDPLHSRNYGACMCALRNDLIQVAGADEHIDYLGHVCGPYELTFRLVNAGKKEIWHQNEFLYHAWHPGSDGDENYAGPHDGKNMSTTALEVIESLRIEPLLENKAINGLRNKKSVNEILTTPLLINPIYENEWQIRRVTNSSNFKKNKVPTFIKTIDRINIVRCQDKYYGLNQKLGEIDLNDEISRSRSDIYIADTLVELERQIEKGMIEKAKEAKLVMETKYYNVVQCRSQFFALRKDLGEIALFEERIGEREIGNSILLSKSIGELLTRIALKRVRVFFDILGTALRTMFLNLIGSILRKCFGNRAFGAMKHSIGNIMSRRNTGPDHPVLLESKGEWNIVYFQGLFYGVPKNFKAIDFFNEKSRSQPGIIVFKTKKEVLMAVDQAKKI